MLSRTVMMTSGRARRHGQEQGAAPAQQQQQQASSGGDKAGHCGRWEVAAGNCHRVETHAVEPVSHHYLVLPARSEIGSC